MVDQLQARPGDAAIWNAIDSKNYKQALKTVEKRLAKKQNDTYFQALKLYIRVEAAVAANKQFVEYASLFLDLQELANSTTALDEDTIILCDDAHDIMLPEQPALWRQNIGTMRWNAVKSSPKNVELAVGNFQACLSKRDLEHAQLICNSLEKNFPQDRKYILWNITLHYLKFLSSRVDPKSRAMSGRMATLLISKLAAATNTAKDVASLPARALHTPQEALLLHRIMQENVTQDERLKYYEDAWVGPGSKISKGNWKLWLDRIKLLNAAERWNELFDITSKLLPLARRNEAGDLVDQRMGDIAVWTSFMLAATKTMEPEMAYKTVMSEVYAHLDKKSGVDKVYRRNARLLEVTVTFWYLKECPEPYLKTIPDGPELPLHQVAVHIQKTVVLLRYLTDNSDIISVFKDLKPHIQCLDVDERKEFLLRMSKSGKFGIAVMPFHVDDKSQSDLSKDKSCLAEYHLLTREDVTACANRYKIVYLITSSLAEYDRHRSIPAGTSACKQREQSMTCIWCQQQCGIYCNTCLEKQARLAILTYGSAIDDGGRISSKLLATDIHPADDFCILAAMCFMKLAGLFPEFEDNTSFQLKGHRLSYLLRAALLLEYAWSRSRANSQISLLLIRIYGHLGCGSLAMRAYHRLGVKQVQVTTLAYTMFDRISTLHPHPFVGTDPNDTKTRSPLDQLESHQKTFRSFSNQVNKNAFRSFESGSYDSVIQLVEAAEFLEQSEASVLSFLESRRISRLTQPDLALTINSHGFDLLPPDTGIKERNANDSSFDYGSFPNFEGDCCPSFAEIAKIAPNFNPERITHGILVERLLYHIDPRVEEFGRHASAMWFKTEYKYHHSAIERAFLATSTTYTAAESSAIVVYTAMAELVSLQLQDAAQGKPDDLIQCIRHHLNIILGIVKDIETKQAVPSFINTLNPLYTAHEMATAVVNFNKYYSKAKGIEDTKAKIKKCASLAEVILRQISDVSEKVRKGIDESGWIDRVLDSVLEGDIDESGEEPSTVAGAIRTTISTDFLENWAGEVIESWRDSVVGLACLKVK